MDFATAGAITDEEIKELVNPKLQITGSTQFLTNTRFEITNAQRIVTSAKANDFSLAACKRLLRYLRKPRVLMYGPCGDERKLRLMVANDSDFASEKDRLSISGIILKFGGNTVGGWSIKQPLNAEQVCEAETI